MSSPGQPRWLDFQTQFPCPAFPDRRTWPCPGGPLPTERPGRPRTCLLCLLHGQGSSCKVSAPLAAGLGGGPPRLHCLGARSGAGKGAMPWTDGIGTFRFRALHFQASATTVLVSAVLPRGVQSKAVLFGGQLRSVVSLPPKRRPSQRVITVFADLWALAPSSCTAFPVSINMSSISATAVKRCVVWGQGGVTIRPGKAT